MTEEWQNVCDQSVLLYRNQQEILANQQTTHAKLDGLETKVDQLGEKLDKLGQQPTTQAPTADPAPAPKRISNLHRQMFVDRLFVERKSLLKKLYASLRKDKKTAVTQAAAIHGLGGIGKTQLALEYAKQYQSEYDLVWWLKAEEQSTLVVDLASLAVPLGLLEPGQVIEDQHRVAAAVVSELSSPQWNGRWLLIYDNVESQKVLRGHLPSGDGHTIITSRDPDWRGLATPLQVDVMTNTEARKLIKERSGQTDTTAAAAIAGRLGNLPLALEVAAAYCHATSLPLQEYVSLLDEVGLGLLDESQPPDYQAIVSKAWQPSFEKAIAECPHAATLLGILAHVAPDDFPDPLVQDTLGGKQELNAAIKALLKYSLISRRQPNNPPYTSYVSIHRLVQEVVREKLATPAGRESFSANPPPDSGASSPAHDSQRFPELALQVVNGAFPCDSDDVTTWPVCDVLLPHANAVVEHVADERDRGKNNPLTRLLNQLGLYHFGRANHAAAEPLMRRALSIDEPSYGENHPRVAAHLNNLAQLLKATNRLSDAEPLMRRALSIDVASYGENHPNVARDCNNLGQLLQATNRLSEAERLMRRALSIDEASYGENHPSVAIRLNNLAQLLQDTNRLSEAEPLMRRALLIDEASYGENHPNVARDCNNLGQLLQATNRLSEAERLMCRALSIDEASYGENHPNVARDLNNLAQLLKATNHLSEAEPLMRHALSIDEASYGENHPNVAIRLNNLALLLQATNRLSDAEPLMRHALSIDEASYGENHPLVAIHLNNLATLLQDTNRLSEAEPLMRRAFAIFAASLGNQHPNTQTVAENYRVLLQAMGLSEDEIAERVRTAMQ